MGPGRHFVAGTAGRSTGRRAEREGQIIEVSSRVRQSESIYCNNQAWRCQGNSGIVFAPFPGQPSQDNRSTAEVRPRSDPGAGSDSRAAAAETDVFCAKRGANELSNAEKTLVTVATYNEIENLPRLVEEIFQFAPQVDLLVIDDNSPDGTGQWCDNRSADDPRVRCLHRPGKLGLGTATIAGMRFALERGYKYVLNMDADFSHPPSRLPDLLDAMEPPGKPPVDVAIGSRYVAGGKIEGWPLRRHLMSRGVNTYARCLLGLGTKDCSGAFRCYRTSLLARIDFDSIRSRGYSFQEEILWHLKRAQAEFKEVPITFVDRQQGSSKIDTKEALAALATIFLLGIRNWRGGA